MSRDCKYKSEIVGLLDLFQFFFKITTLASFENHVIFNVHLYEMRLKLKCLKWQLLSKQT